MGVRVSPDRGLVYFKALQHQHHSKSQTQIPTWTTKSRTHGYEDSKRLTPTYLRRLLLEKEER